MDDTPSLEEKVADLVAHVAALEQGFIGADRLEQLHKRIGQLEEFVEHAITKFESAIAVARPVAELVAGAAQAVAPDSTVAKAAELVEAGVAWTCPDHPDASTQDNRCNAEGCDQRAPQP